MRDTEELQKSHVLKVEELSRRKLTEDQDTIMELRTRIQELQNEVNCMNDARRFEDAESVRSGPSLVPSQPALLPLCRDPGGLLSRNNQPPDIWNSQGTTGNVSANPLASSSSPYPGGFNSWISNVTEDTHVLISTGQPLTCGERQIPDTVTPRFQPGPSVGDLINKEYDDNEQETSETKTDAFALKTEVFVFASRSKAKAKPRRPTSAGSSVVPLRERIWTDFEPGAQIDQAYPVAKRLNTLLRHGELPREEDGEIEFWRLKDDLRKRFEYSQYWSDDLWKNKMAGGGGNKKRLQYCTDPSGQEILHFRALQGHSGRNSSDPSLQRNVLIPNNFFEYINHAGCAVNLHSVTNSGLIAGGQKSSRDRQTVFFTAVNPMHKNHQNPKELDLTKPRLASHKQKWKVHQDTVYWVDRQLAQRKGLKFYQTMSNAVILYVSLQAYCISKVVDGI